MEIERIKNRVSAGARVGRLVGICLMAAVPASTEAAVLASIEGLEAGDIEVRGFELTRSQEVTIQALALASRDRERENFYLADAWVLDAESREVVWQLADARSKARGRSPRKIDEKLRLGAGTYEAFYATYPTSYSSEYQGWWESAARTLSRMFGWDDEQDYEYAVSELSLKIEGEGRRLSKSAVAEVRDELAERALVSLPARSDNSSEYYGFVFEKPMDLEVYALGELGKSSGLDFGWIINTETREKVWQLTWESSEAAGGAKKNRMVHDRMHFPAGTYAAHFVTDDSHSPERWNALPPRDPAFWGLTLWATDPQQKRYVKRYDYQHMPGEQQVIAELTRLRDDDHRSWGFTLEEPMDVRIYAVGEGTPAGMADGGWIVDARTRQKIWAMDYERTEHAGGGTKNRVADEMLRLEAGSYVVSFATDGSHAYRDWNTAPPTYPERWGITIFGEKGFDRSAIREYRVEDDVAVLARISRVRSDSHRRLEFVVERKAEVSVYALGEGIDDEMYDYAWLEDKKGRVVWEMTYPMTDSAGGASKNRRYHGILELVPGDYTLHYRTDDSHAYKDWNDSPPNDPESWGVQVALVH